MSNIPSENEVRAEIDEICRAFPESVQFQMVLKAAVDAALAGRPPLTMKDVANELVRKNAATIKPETLDRTISNIVKQVRETLSVYYDEKNPNALVRIRITPAPYTATIQYDERTRHRTALENRLGELEKMLAGANQAVSDARAKQHELESDLTQAKHDLTERAETIRILNKQIDEQQQHISDLQTAISDAHAEQQRISVELNNLKHEHGNRGAELDAARREIQRRRRITWLWRAGEIGIAGVVIAFTAWWLWPDRSVLQLQRLTPAEGIAVTPTFSPDSNRVAYAADYGKGNLDIWTMRPEKGGSANPEQITFDPADDYAPSFSHDGSHLAFRSERAGGGVYVVHLSSRKTVLYAAGGRDPRFSPDGNRIAYWRGEPNTKIGDVLVDTFPTHSKEPTRIPMDRVRNPVWSSDGRFLLFLAFTDDEGTDQDWWITDLKSSPRQTFANKAATAGRVPLGAPLQWANDQVLFATRGGTASLWYIRVPLRTGTADGGPRPVDIAVAGGNEITGSSDGERRLVFTSVTERTDIVGLPLSGQTQRGVERLVSFGDHIYPSVSGTGETLAFVTELPSGRWISRVEPNKAIMMLTPTAWQDDSPKITPDGTGVAYADFIDEKWPVFLTRPDGPPKRVCGHCGPPRAWHPTLPLLLYENKATRPYSAGLLEVETGKTLSILEHEGDTIYPGGFSPDGQWLTFHVRGAKQPLQRTIYVAPFSPQPIPKHRWIAITDGKHLDQDPVWAADNNAIFFHSQRDTFRCIWKQHLDPITKEPRGVPSHVRHFAGSQSLSGVGSPGRIGLSATPTRLIFSLRNRTGSLWLATLAE